MVRFPRFRIARLWVPEYGDPEEPADLAWLLSYSPYHRVVDGTRYPAVLITTGAEDSRVDPLHARKMAARLQQAAPADGAPVLLRVERGRRPRPGQAVLPPGRGVRRHPHLPRRGDLLTEGPGLGVEGEAGGGDAEADEDHDGGGQGWAGRRAGAGG
jgi:hypothetical protein